MDFGVVPDVRSEIKFFTGVFLKDVGCFGIVIGSAFLLGNLFPAEQTVQQTLFMITSVILAIYLDLRPHTNPGKRNFEVIWMLIVNRQPRLFKSFGYERGGPELWRLEEPQVQIWLVSSGMEFFQDFLVKNVNKSN